MRRIGSLLLLHILCILEVATALKSPAPLTPPRPLRTRSPFGSLVVPALAAFSLVCTPVTLPAATLDMPLVRESEEVLHEPAQEVDVFDEELAELSKRMLDVMYTSGGIGLAGARVSRERITSNVNVKFSILWIV